MKRLQIFLFLIGFLVVTSCGTLDKTGVYQGDVFLYNAELAVPTAYEVIHTFVTWEFQNRTALVKYPEITQAADLMRVNSPKWFASANAAHDAYKADPSASNKSAYQLILDEIKTALTQASAYMVKVGTAK